MIFEARWDTYVWPSLNESIKPWCVGAYISRYRITKRITSNSITNFYSYYMLQLLMIDCLFSKKNIYLLVFVYVWNNPVRDSNLFESNVQKFIRRGILRYSVLFRLVTVPASRHVVTAMWPAMTAMGWWPLLDTRYLCLGDMIVYSSTASMWQQEKGKVYFITICKLDRDL